MQTTIHSQCLTQTKSFFLTYATGPMWVSEETCFNWSLKAPGCWWRFSCLSAAPYGILTSLVAVTGQERGARHSMLQARSDICLLLTTHWPDLLFCAPAYFRGAGKCGSAHDIQWVVNTSATIPVANGFSLWSHLPRAGEGRVQRYVFTTLCLPLYALSVLPSYMTDHSYTPQEIMLIYRSHHPSDNMYKMLGNFPY